VWNSNWWNDITWLNKAGPKEIAVVHLTVSAHIPLNEFVLIESLQYGNEAGIDWHYSYAAILVNVPPFLERRPGGRR
jgi:hypothetical protein